MIKRQIICLFLLLFVSVCAYPADATEYIKVFFNQPESSQPSKSEIANPDKGIDDALIEFLQTARAGDLIYLCFYSSPTVKVANAISSAAAVVGDSNIFHIMEEEYGGSVNDSADDPGIFSFSNTIDDGSDGSPLMHNKFAVIIDTVNSEGRVWTGSYNPTDNGTNKNNNDAVWIESYELADYYSKEFIYMWNGGNGKFSVNKATSSNTAKTVSAGDVSIEVYFSPYAGSAATNTSMKIEELIDSAEYSVFFCMFTFSENESRIISAIEDAYSRGVEVKGVVEASQSAAVHEEFRKLGMDVFLDANAGSLHNKFCIIDYGTSHPKVITGSYNWTPAARDTNDENFLVIHSAAVAELYWREFQKSYAFAGGSSLDTDTASVSDVIIYPSPAKDVEEVTIGYTLSSAASDVTITVYTISGEKVIKIEPDFYAGTYNEYKWNLENSAGDNVAPGLYYVKVDAETGDGTFFDIEKFAVIR